MNDRNLRLQVVMSAIDKLTRPFKEARASTQELAASVKKSRDALNQLDQTSSRLEGFKKLQAENQKLGDRLNYARQKALLMNQELGASGPPTQRQILALEKQRLAVQRLEERQGKLQTRTAEVRAELYRAGISANDGASATARITRETERFNRQLAEQEARLKRAGEQQRKMTAAREQYGKTLEIRDRVAGAGAAMTGAGVAAGAPVVAAVKDYAGLEDAMKGVAKQVNGLRDANGNRTAQFYEMQAAIKDASEQLPMQNGAVDYAALVEGGARMGIGGDAKNWAEQKKELLDFASVTAKASVAFELPADQLAEDMGKIAQLYKVPISNIEQLGDVINYLDDNAMSKGADIIDVLKRMGDTAGQLNYQKAAALGSTFLTLGSAPEVAASAAKAMVRELSIATIQGKRFQAGMAALKMDPAKLQKSMSIDAMGTIVSVLERVNKLKPDDRTPMLTQLFGKEFGDDAAKLAQNLPELRRQLELTQGQAAKGSMQKESDINKDSLSAQWMLTKAGTQNVMSGLGESLRPPLMEIMRDIQPVIRSLRLWVEQNPQLTATVMKVVASLAAMAIALGAVLIGVAGVIGPLAVIRLSMQTLGIKLIPTVVSAVSRFGGVLSFLLSPLNLVRSGMMFIGSAMGLLLSPVTLVIAALAGVALVIWKYWQPISAFLGGVVVGFKAAAAPILEAFAPLQPVFGWIGDKVRALFGWFSDLLTPVKSTKEELASAAEMGKRFGQFLADSLSMALSPLETLKTGVSWLLDKLGIVNQQASTARLPSVNNGNVQLPPGGFPLMYDTGGYIPRGRVGIVGENGPELVNGPANITSRRRTAALAGATALAFGSLSTPVTAKPLHPFSLPGESRTQSASVPAAPAQININIHPSANQSPADIAREVARQLDEINRKNAARSRSSFRDQGGYDS